MGNNQLNQKPLISFVLMARNDGYAGDYVTKIQRTISSIAYQAQKFGLNIELLLVEWNPPKGTTALYDVLDKVSNDYLDARIITVSPKFHRGFRGKKEKGMHTMKALNVGIRRAQGLFITPIASDIIIADTVFEFIVNNTLDISNVYRLDRCDVDSKALESFDCSVASIKEIQNVCPQHVLLRHENLEESMEHCYGLLPLHTNACGDFTLMSRAAWHAMNGYREACDISCLDGDSVGLFAAVCSGIKQFIMPSDCVVYKPSHGLISALRVIDADTVGNKIKKRIISLITEDQAKQRYWRETLDYPRRKVIGMTGTYASMDSNFVAPARKWIKTMPCQVQLSGRNWGLGKHKLPVRNI